jgi:photosystem II stability/assembly factor-like uncharacterized protein
MFTVGSSYFNSAYWLQTSFTTDGGTTWQRDTLDSLYRGYAAAFDPTDPNRMYLGGDSMYSYPLLSISTDMGLTWTKSAAGLAGSVAVITPVPRDPNTVYCGTNQGVYQSTDAGAVWTRKGTMTNVRAIVVDTVNTNVVYAGTYTGVFASTDGGVTWNPFNTGLVNTDIMSLALRSGPGGMLLAGTNGAALYATTPLVGVAGRPFDTRHPSFDISPNPCRGIATIRYCSPTSSLLSASSSLSVIDASGRCVRQSTLSSRQSSVVLDLRALPAGTYFARLAAGGRSHLARLVLLE